MGYCWPKQHTANRMTLNETRSYTQRVIKALHLAGWHRQGIALGDSLNGIGYQPLPSQWAAVLDEADRWAGQLLSAGCPAPRL